MRLANLAYYSREFAFLNLKLKLFRQHTGSAGSFFTLKQYNNIAGNNVTNYVLNGSFESVNLSGIPDGWGAGTWGLRGINAQYPEQWRQSFQVSDQYAFNGKKSVMLTPQTAIPHPQLWSCWQIIPSAAAQISSWNLSGYVYSKQNGKIKLALLEAGARDFEVLTEQEFSFSAGKWQRFAIKSHNLPQRVIIRFTADCSEAVYVDAIQLEADKISEFVPGINDKKYLFPTAGAAPGVFQPDKLLTLPSEQITELTCKDGVFRQNGRAFIPFAFGAQTTQLDANMVKRVRENGFNAINLYIQKSKDVESLKIAQVGGLYTIPWMRPATEADFPNLIKAIGNDSGVIAIMAIDEPPNPLSPHVLKRFRTSRQLLPSKPVMINYRTAEINTFKSRMTDLPGDIISCDQYPLGNFIFPGTVHDCAELIKKMSGELIPAKRGVWNYFQLSGNAFMNFREPSPAEFEYMIYSSLLAGCRGFITFHNQPLSNDLWLTAGRVSREISALSPVVIDGKNLDKLPPMPPEILIAGWRWENYNYYILVNTSEKNISYDWNISDSQLCFESDSNINKFSLNPLRRRVYRCKVSN